MPPKTRQSRLTATERVLEYIRHSIYKGALKPRERIIEEDIAKHLKCSRGPVREAFLRLERDGLLVMVPRRGTFIRDISEESIQLIFDIRGKLEALCVRFLREYPTDQVERKLRRILKELKTAAKEKDEEAFFAADMHFHQTLWHLSGRPLLENTLATIMNPFIFMIARSYSSQTPLNVRYADHAKYLETVLSAPVPDAERYVEQYFQKKQEEIFAQYYSPSAIGRSPFPGGYPST